MQHREKVFAKNRKAWRTWLEKHHEQQEGVWLVYDKPVAGKPRQLTYDDMVEEALCFGWVDSLSKVLNTTQTMLYMAPRKAKSNWSKSNRERIAKLTKQGLMRPAGQRMVALAKKTGTWTALVGVQAGVIPSDLQQAFKKNKKAWENFSKFPSSSKRIILEWILNAKRPETRKARIAETVKLAVQNIRANHYRQ